MINTNSQIAYQAVDAKAIRAAIRELFIQHLPGTALTVPQILEGVQELLGEPTLILNSVAPRITELSHSQPPELVEAGQEEYLGRTGKKLRRAKYRLERNSAVNRRIYRLH